MIGIYLFLRKKIGADAAKLILLESHRDFCLTGAAKTDNIYFFQYSKNHEEYLLKAIEYKSFKVIQFLADIAGPIHMKKAVETNNVRAALYFSLPIFTKENIVLIAKLDLVNFAKLDSFKRFYLKYDSVKIYKYFRGYTIPKDYVYIVRYCPIKILDSMILSLTDFCYLYKIAILHENEDFVRYCFKKYDYFISEDFLLMATKFPKIINEFVKVPNARLCRQLVFNNDVMNIKKFIPQINNIQELFEFACNKNKLESAKILLNAGAKASLSIKTDSFLIKNFLKNNGG